VPDPGVQAGADDHLPTGPLPCAEAVRSQGCREQWWDRLGLELGHHDRHDRDVDAGGPGQVGRPGTGSDHQCVGRDGPGGGLDAHNAIGCRADARGLNAVRRSRAEALRLGRPVRSAQVGLALASTGLHIPPRNSPVAAGTSLRTWSASSSSTPVRPAACDSASRHRKVSASSGRVCTYRLPPCTNSKSASVAASVHSRMASSARASSEECRPWTRSDPWARPEPSRPGPSSLSSSTTRAPARPVLPRSRRRRRRSRRPRRQLRWAARHSLTAAARRAGAAQPRPPRRRGRLLAGRRRGCRPPRPGWW
jgi:hypothetical protein